MCLTKTIFIVLTKARTPSLSAIWLYCSCLLKYSIYFCCCSSMLKLLFVGLKNTQVWPRCSLFDKVLYSFKILMLSSTRSTWVKTPIVLIPSLSISRANLRDYEFAESSVAFDTAIIMQFGFLMYPFIILRTCYSISFGWSPVGFWIWHLLPSQCLGDQQVINSILSLSKTSLLKAHYWFLCWLHKPFRFQPQ